MCTRQDGNRHGGQLVGRRLQALVAPHSLRGHARPEGAERRRQGDKDLKKIIYLKMAVFEDFPGIGRKWLKLFIVYFRNKMSKELHP